jgi:glycine cleavage system H protein
MATKIPAELRYTAEHEWARDNGDGTLTIGITDFAQDALGDVTFVDLPTAGRVLSQGETFGVVESVKTFSDLYAPVAGEVVEANSALGDDPAAVNTDPYGAGWMLRIRVTDPAAFGGLLDATGYAAVAR